MPFHALFDAMHKKSRTSAPTSWEVRRQYLWQLRKFIEENQETIIDTIARDFGHRSRHETLLLEIMPSLSAISDALKHGRRWMKPRAVKTDWWFWPAKNRLLPQPRGVVGVLVPWNYPLYLLIAPLVPALAAGCHVMAKMSEFTPHFSRWVAETLPNYLSTNTAHVVTGGADVAREFSALAFDHLLFTGSTATGRHVMQAAAKNLTPVTLELGGKSPSIILPSANLERAVDRIMAGKMLNAGQTCIAPDYVLLPEYHVPSFCNLAKKWLAKHYPKLENTPDYTSIINAQHWNRITHLVESAKASGANIIPLSDTPNDARQRRFSPVIAIDVKDNTPLATEEIFAPILPLQTYETLKDAIHFVNRNPRPLALYVFGEKKTDIDLVLQQTSSGGVCVNETLLHAAQEALPFGGIGPSGMGVYHGQAGFDTFSHLKPVFIQSKINSMKLFAAPYNARFEKILQLLFKVIR